MSATPVQEHFDKEAERYDFWKERNWHYYDTIKSIYGAAISPDQSVLEVGCGTGDILASLHAKRAVGLDISAAMIEIAKHKYPSIEWHACSLPELSEKLHETFDVIFLSDVIEHLEDVHAIFRDLRPLCHAGTTLFVNMANPLWEPILMVLEWLRMKMPEGPHHRISVATLSGILAKNGFRLTKRSFRLLLPKYIPVLSPFFAALERLPVVRRLCLIEVLQYSVTS